MDVQFVSGAIFLGVGARLAKSLVHSLTAPWFRMLGIIGASSCVVALLVSMPVVESEDWESYLNFRVLMPISIALLLICLGDESRRDQVPIRPSIHLALPVAKLSYCAYLFHMYFLDVSFRLSRLGEFSETGAAAVFWILYFALTFVCAKLLYDQVEMRFYILGTHKMDKSAPR